MFQKKTKSSKSSFLTFFSSAPKQKELSISGPVEDIAPTEWRSIRPKTVDMHANNVIPANLLLPLNLTSSPLLGSDSIEYNRPALLHFDSYSSNLSTNSKSSFSTYSYESAISPASVKSPVSPITPASSASRGKRISRKPVNYFESDSRSPWTATDGSPPTEGYSTSSTKRLGSEDRAASIYSDNSSIYSFDESPLDFSRGRPVSLTSSLSAATPTRLSKAFSLDLYKFPSPPPSPSPIVSRRTSPLSPLSPKSPLSPTPIIARTSSRTLPSLRLHNLPPIQPSSASASPTRSHFRSNSKPFTSGIQQKEDEEDEILNIYARE